MKKIAVFGSCRAEQAHVWKNEGFFEGWTFWKVDFE